MFPAVAAALYDISARTIGERGSCRNGALFQQDVRSLIRIMGTRRLRHIFCVYSVGVLIKSPDVLEWMEKVDTLEVYKTGTLTEGTRPMVAALAMSLSSVSVIANALRLRSVSFPL